MNTKTEKKKNSLNNFEEQTPTIASLKKPPRNLAAEVLRNLKEILFFFFLEKHKNHKSRVKIHYRDTMPKLQTKAHKKRTLNASFEDEVQAGAII